MSKYLSVYKNKFLEVVVVERIQELVVLEIHRISALPAFYLLPFLELISQVLVVYQKAAIYMPRGSQVSEIEESLVAIGFKEDFLSDARVLIVDTESLMHPLNYRANEYFELANSQERVLFGLSHSDWESTNVLRNVPNPNFKTLPLRKLDSFEKIVEQRESAHKFESLASRSKFEIDCILNDSYYLKPDGRAPTGSAGGFKNIYVTFATSGLKDLEPGLYIIEKETRDWVQIDRGDYSVALREVCLYQDILVDCDGYLIFELDLVEMSKKYGSRSYSYSLIGLGSLLDRLHLSCTSYGLKFRIIGGFDEVLLKRLLSLNKNRIVPVVVAIS